MKKTGFNGYIYDFSVDYEATDDDDDIKDIQKMLIKKISVNENIWICLKIVFYKINNFIRFHKRKFNKLYFNEPSRV